MNIDKRTIAREWLIFVIVEGLCLLGALLWCYWHYSRPFRPDLQAYPDQYHWFDEFWNDLFKFPEWRTLAGWFVWPYLLLILLRSVFWSIKILRR